MNDLYGLMMLLIAGYRKGPIVAIGAQDIDLWVGIGSGASDDLYQLPNVTSTYSWGGTNDDMTLFRNSSTALFEPKLELKHPNGNTAWDFENTTAGNILLRTLGVTIGPVVEQSGALDGDALFPFASPTGGDVTLEPQQIARFTSLKVGLRG